MNDAPNFLDLYQQYASEITDASPDYHKFMGLGVLSVALGHKVYMPWGDGHIYPNLWIIFIGQSTVDHKSTAVRIGFNLIDRWDHTKIYPNDYSYESLIKILSKQPTGAFFYDEFKTFIGMLNRDYMGPARGFLATMYDGGRRYKKELSGETYTIENPATSIYTATTTAWLLENLKESDIEGGFLPRFIIVPCLRMGEDLPRPPMACKHKRGMMLDIMTKVNTLGGPCYFTEDAGKMFDQWYHKMRGKNIQGRLAPFAGRLQGYLVKFAILFEINRSYTLKISKDSMSDGIRAVDWLYKQIIILESDELVFSKGHKDMQKIRKVLRKSPDKKMTRKGLIRATRLLKFEIDRAIIDLHELDEIQEETVRISGTKKPTTTYRLVV